MYKFKKTQKFVKLSSLLADIKIDIDTDTEDNIKKYQKIIDKKLLNKALTKLKNGELKFINIDLFHYGTNNVPRIAYDKKIIDNYYIDIHHNRYKMRTDLLEISDKRGENNMVIRAELNTVTIILNDEIYVFSNIK